MTREQAEIMIEALKSGKIPHHAAEKVMSEVNGPEALRRLRAAIGFDRFREVMRKLVQPNRAAFELRKFAAHIENEDDWKAMSDRIAEELRRMKP